ncbi:hypothetical protein [Streptomyces sp. ITFR-16]|uniref:hypothetical protein n=1 Tax=Streptomyces sp. ITFR-16 TaxID=3075198 RepID=UPI00288BC3A7|nr:hypothetical protein [Streptomyces sp. ITFR-16]WNI24929.1 hypothetical protein RLT58_24940 [Streptomyces sp. ITFR-16]
MLSLGARRIPMLLALVVALTAGCALVPSDPADPPMFGARFDGKSITVKMPLCPEEKLRRIDVRDADDTGTDSPRLVWWATGPRTERAESGTVDLWSGRGFTKHAPVPTATPVTVNIGYTDVHGDGRDDVLPLGTIAEAHLAAGKFWTPQGGKSAAEIDAQLHCGK